jgi:hypothetical protein
MEEGSNRFLFVNDKRKSNKKKKHEPPVSVCEYGLYPVNHPMNIDDFKFDLRGNFLKRLSKLYYDISQQGKKISIEKSKDKLSPKLFIRDVLTEYTVRNIFDIKTQNKLIHIINTIIKSLYKKFYEETGIELFFIYRGGNILKLYKDRFESILPGLSRDLFNQEFGKYFKNSDIDFYTVVKNRDILKEEELYMVNIYIQMMCYYALYISRIFIMNNFNLFEYCKLNSTAMKMDFNEILNKLNVEKLKSDSEMIQKSKFIGLGFNEFMYMKEDTIQKVLDRPQSNIISSDLETWKQYKLSRSTGKRDINIDPKDNSVDINDIDYFQEPLFKIDFEKNMKELINKNKILEYYISNNNEIYSQDTYIEFGLVRLMINFVVVYKNNGKYGITNGPSELFDLSIGRPGDKSYNVYRKDTLTTYQFEYDEGMKDEIFIPKLETTILDLVNILFFPQTFPWEDEKYEKRLYRLLILVFVKQISNHTLSQTKKMLLSKRAKKIVLDGEETFETLLFRNEEMKHRITPQQNKNYKDYINKYNQIIKKLLNVLNKLSTFVKSDKQVKEEEIYDF